MAVFQARARTVDMLGYQQVTDIATAISELFKNAHDAYATGVDIDYLRPEDLLVIRDNGIGMSPDNFESRWLTLAVDNTATREDPPRPPGGMKARPIQGEKGIGRLAIATIGPQALVLTRPRGRNAPLTFALINWRLFEVAGLNLGQIEIPVQTYKRGSGPKAKDLRRLAGQTQKTIKALKLKKADARKIEGDLELLEFDPSALLGVLGSKPVTAEGHGTAFVVTPTRPELLDDLKSIEGEADPPPGLLKTLIGFSNTMVPDAGKPRIRTTFRDHRSADDVDDVIATREFFTVPEFEEADHNFTGEFDRFGHFKGTVDVYSSGPKDYPWTWAGAKGRELLCGPFKLSVAYVQGKSSESSLDPKAFSALEQKLQRFGGIYVYRDGIRVLPYGDPEFDFLQFEERRSRQAGRAFFSYRRMFGAIELDGTENAELREKAGREGFRNDRAYRDFTGLLRDFFVKVAADFFVEGGEQAEQFQIGRERTRERHKRLREREAEAKKKLKAFEKELAVALTEVDEERPPVLAQALLASLKAALASKKMNGPNREELLEAVESQAFEDLDELRARYRLRAPAGFGLSVEQRREWEGLLVAAESLESEVWAPTAMEISALVTAARRKAGMPPERRARLIEVVDSAAQRRENEAITSADKVRRSLSSFDKDVDRSIDSLVKAVADAAEAASKAARNGGGRMANDKELDSRRRQIETDLTISTRGELEELSSLAELLGQGLAAVGAVHGSTSSLAGMLEEEMLELRDRAEQDLELAQVGMATQVISHELNATVLAVRSGLRRLSVWAEENEDLRPLYDDLRGSFDHLDSYLSLFTPLQRRLRRRREQLTGKRIEAFLTELFARRLEKEEIELRVTPAFREWRASGYRSTVYPALVNVVDNAAFWVSESVQTPRWVKLDASKKGDLLVSDSGPGIPERDREAIWEFGFTRKPRGRGAGLHIAREVLQREGWSIDLAKPRKGQGAVFRISAEQ